MDTTDQADTSDNAHSTAAEAINAALSQIDAEVSSWRINATIAMQIMARTQVIREEVAALIPPAPRSAA